MIKEPAIIAVAQWNDGNFRWLGVAEQPKVRADLFADGVIPDHIPDTALMIEPKVALVQRLRNTTNVYVVQDVI